MYVLSVHRLADSVSSACTVACAVLLLFAGLGSAWAQPAPAASKPPVQTAAEPVLPKSIKSLTDAQGAKEALAVGLNNDLSVIVDTESPLDPTHFSLFLNGQEIKGLDDTDYDDARHALIFHLKRSAKNEQAWNGLLGAPMSLTRPVSVALGYRNSAAHAARPTMIEGETGKQPTFKLVILSPIRLVTAVFAIALLCTLVLGGARHSTALRDNLLPQIPKNRQTFSLGRCQMAFWFTLIFTSYVFLYIILGDANVLNEQALMLMGIASATALAAVAVDVQKDTQADAVNSALRAIGITNYTDVLGLELEIAQRQDLLVKELSAAIRDQIRLEIDDRRNKLKVYKENIQAFTSVSWFDDITTDINGTALHRLQVVCWTALLGVIFLFEVWRDLGMPQFSSTLLALMGISGAGYVGFKYPESQH